MPLAQFGKNHLGDLNKYLPTAHGFDEFFGNLYHLNAEEEPELPDYPKKEEFPGFTRCGIHAESSTPGRPTRTTPRRTRSSGVSACRRIEDTGPLTKKRMETIDDEIVGACIDFIKRQKESDTPFFVWMNTTHMHLRTHTKPESRGQADIGSPPITTP